jgi:hypothetical protein
VQSARPIISGAADPMRSACPLTVQLARTLNAFVRLNYPDECDNGRETGKALDPATTAAVGGRYIQVSPAD